MSALIKDTSRGIERILPEDVLFTNRELFITEEINADTCHKLLKELMALEKMDCEKEVTIYINSPGGDVDSGLAVFDYMQLMKSPIRTVCVGTAASMGAMLFLAGDTREMLAHSRIMIHDPAYGGGNMAGKKPHELQYMVDKLKQTQEVLAGIISEKTGKPLKEVYKKTKQDSYFNAQEAIEYGLATGMVKTTNSESSIKI
ncbi:MAG: ATP-dependent Clp protease proteolytic subunit [Lachnospiraceae bacterium]|nr:ATP-dependent Clp protease proteolytic subunit [Lachnospiraceae bacterium]